MTEKILVGNYEIIFDNYEIMFENNKIIIDNCDEKPSYSSMFNMVKSAVVRSDRSKNSYMNDDMSIY